MKKYAIGLIAIILLGCGTSQLLTPGLWSASMSPMNHPEMTTELQFDISKIEGRYDINILGPEGLRLPTQKVSVQKGVLTFQFEEPEQGVLLTCTFKGDNKIGYEGRCHDADGKWAHITLSPPE